MAKRSMETSYEAQEHTADQHVAGMGANNKADHLPNTAGPLQRVYLSTIDDDSGIHEHMFEDCTLKNHTKLNWFWRVISALHACGHAFVRFPCLTERDEVRHNDGKCVPKA